jgi:hypothetical protein
MAGKWPDHETPQGGLCEKSLAEFIATRLDEYERAAKTKAQQVSR